MRRIKVVLAATGSTGLLALVSGQSSCVHTCCGQFLRWSDQSIIGTRSVMN